MGVKEIMGEAGAKRCNVEQDVGIQHRQEGRDEQRSEMLHPHMFVCRLIRNRQTVLSGDYVTLSLSLR